MIGISLYFFIFRYIYINWLSPIYIGWNFIYNEPPAGYTLFAFLLSILPTVWIPICLKRTTQFIYLILYITVFIPSMQVPLYMALESPFNVACFMVTLTGGFAIIGGSYFLPLFKVRFIKISRFTFWAVFFALTLILMLYCFYIFRGHMEIVSFWKVYDLRLRSREIIKGTTVGYAIMLLSSVINPFLMSWGLVHKKIIFFSIGALGQIFLYSTTASKSVILSILFIILFYIILKGRQIYWSLKIVWGIVAVLAGLLIINLIFEVDNDNALFLASSIIFMRLFGTPGLLSGQYHHFFQNNPLTYYSHVTGINLLVDNPYERPVSFEIGYYFMGNIDLNQNAHFWATDGLAALGLLGIIVISILCFFIFWLVDSLVVRHALIFTVLTTIFITLNLSNASLFTVLASGGLSFLTIMLYFLPPTKSNRPT